MTADVSQAPGHRPVRRYARWPRVAMSTGYAVLAATAVGLPAARFPAVIAGVLLFGVLVLVFGVLAATRVSLQPGVRRAWWLLSIGFLLLNLIPMAFVVADPHMAGSTSTTMSSPPGLGELLRLLAGLPMLAGLVTFPRSHATRRDIHKLLLDVVTVVGGSFMVLWDLVLGPALTSHLPTLTMAAAAAYPVGDLALIFGATVVVLRGAHASVRRPITILLAGLSMLVVSDTYLGYAKLHPGDTHQTALQLGIMMTGLFLLALAGLEQCIVAGDDDTLVPGHRHSNRGSKLPYAALAVGSGLLIVQAVRSGGFYPWGGLIVGAVVMTAAVALRQLIAMRENHDLVTRDSLTGLANRVRLHEALGRAVERSNRTGERTAVLLIDMDGFKQINDTLGHSAGDELLIGFARLLTASVLGSDTVARLGGDEFAIVLNNVGTTDNAGAVATRLIAGMQEPVAVNGEPVCPAASIGIAVSTPGHPMTAGDLLHRADMAMYQAKNHPGNNYRFHTDTTPHSVTALG